MLKVATRRATSTANSYTNTDYADEYFAIFIDSVWEALELDEKEGALIRATAYIDGHYDFIGKVKSVSQSLAWPRVGAVDSDGRLHDGIPDQVKQSTCELALESALNELDSPLIDEDFIRSESSKVGDIEDKVEYSPNKPFHQVFPKVDGFLKSLIMKKSSAFSVKLER